MVAVSTSVATATWYYRFGSPARGRAAQWYSWDYDSLSGLGGQRISPTEWVLHFIDGAAGDDDGSANGTIVDPGGPGIGPQLTADPVTQDTTPGTPTLPAVPVTDPTVPNVALPTVPVYSRLPTTGRTNRRPSSPWPWPWSAAASVCY